MRKPDAHACADGGASETAPVSPGDQKALPERPCRSGLARRWTFRQDGPRQRRRQHEQPREHLNSERTGARVAVRHGEDRAWRCTRDSVFECVASQTSRIIRRISNQGRPIEIMLASLWRQWAFSSQATPSDGVGWRLSRRCRTAKIRPRSHSPARRLRFWRQTGR